MPTHSASQRWRAPIALIVLALLFACLKGRSPTEAGANDVRFDLSAQVSGGSVLHITVVYLDQPPTTESLVPVMLLDQRINVAAGTQSLPLTIDLTRCLADPQHVTGSTCELFAGVVLEQGGQTVDSIGVGPVTVTPGQVVHANTSFVPVGHVDVFPTTLSLTVGAIGILKDSVFSPTNVYLPDLGVTWASADANIAKVNANGAVTGVAIGTTTVTASAGGQSNSATITVSATGGSGTIVVNAPVGVTFQAPPGSTIPASAPIKVTSLDTTVVISGLTSTIAYGAGQPTGWLTANMSDSLQLVTGARVVSRQVRKQTSGGIVTPAVLDMVPNTTNLAAGTYTAKVTVHGTNATSGSVNVTYTINAGTPTLAFTPNPVTFSQYAYGSTVAPLQTVTAYNAGTGTLGSLSTVGTIVYTGADTGWITIAAASATTATGQPKTTALHLGSDTARIPISAIGATNNPVTLTAIVSTYVTYTKVVLGASFGCGLTTASTVYCWGGDGQGELGDSTPGLGNTIPVRTKLPYSSTNPVIDIEAGSAHACALTQNGTAYCWGSNGNGQVGDGNTTSPVTKPVQITGTWGQITLGAQHTCAIQGTPPLAGANYVYCWGNNTDGQFGNNLPSGTPQTTPLNTGLIYYAIAAGGLHTCGINNKVVGGLYCWGDDASGQLGNGYSGTFYSAPVQANVHTVTGGLAVVTSVSAGNSTTCAVDNAGTGYCWGDNTYGEVGNGNTTTPVLTPTIIPGGYSWTSISVGVSSVCGIASTADYCWGYNGYGQLGNGATANSGTPTPTAVIGSGSLFTEFVVGQGSQSACYITGGVVSCFGLDGNGELGIGSATSAVPNPTAMVDQPAPAGVGPSRVVPRRRPAFTRTH